MKIIATLIAACLVLASLLQGVIAFRDLKSHSGRPKRWLITLSICVVLAIISGFVSYTSPDQASSPQGTIAISTTVPSSSTSSATAALASTPSPTATSASTSYYSAAQPGPGCDTNGGTWTPQGISGVTCGSWVTNYTGATWGYLFFQLPNNAAFASNNEISVALSNIDSLNYSCVGLAEIGSTTGYMASFCQNNTNPNWTIYSVSNQGTIIRPLSTNATSNRTNTTLLLSIVNNTLKFAIDTESHQISITSFQPTKVAIAFYNNGCGNCTAKTSNFNYITPVS